MSYSTIVTLGKTISIFKFDLSWEHVWYVWFTSLSQLHKRFIKGSPPVQYFIMMYGKHVFQMLEYDESWGQALSWSYTIEDTHLERIHLHIFSCNVLCNTTKIKIQMSYVLQTDRFWKEYLLTGRNYQPRVYNYFILAPNLLVALFSMSNQGNMKKSSEEVWNSSVLKGLVEH